MDSNEKDKYREFSENDFLCDEFFQNWVLRKDVDSDNFWQRWMEEHPGKAPVARAAESMILNLQFREDLPDTDRMLALRERAMAEISTEPIGGRVVRTDWRRRLLRIAAVFILVLGSGILLNHFLGKVPLKEQLTGFGDTRTVILPDSSLIVLNANSRLSYPETWKEGAPREVWLEGEAQFRIRHLDTDNRIKTNERFLVHIKDVTVEVLGTTFNIRQRRGETSVVLQGGKIALFIKDESGSRIDMLPGQVVRIDELTKSYRIDSVPTPEEQSAWVNKQMILKSVPLSHIIESLEDYYGVQIVLSDPGLASRKIEGTIMLDNLDDALFVLSKILNVKITKKDEVIYFFPN